MTIPGIETLPDSQLPALRSKLLYEHLPISIPTCRHISLIRFQCLGRRKETPRRGELTGETEVRPSSSDDSNYANMIQRLRKPAVVFGRFLRHTPTSNRSRAAPGGADL